MNLQFQIKGLFMCWSQFDAIPKLGGMSFFVNIIIFLINTTLLIPQIEPCVVMGHDE